MTIIKMCKHLQAVQPLIGDWHIEQNDAWDKLCNVWGVDNFYDLRKYIEDLPKIIQQYTEKRWFSVWVAKCDEYLFCLNRSIIHNSNSKSQKSDIIFLNKNDFEFDLKSTRPFVDNIWGEDYIDAPYFKIINKHINDPDLLAKLYYVRQSNGIRESYHNRLFIVHCGKNTNYLKTLFQTKNRIFNNYIKHFNNKNTIPLILPPFKKDNDIISGLYYDIIFIVELKKGVIGYQFASDPIKKLKTMNIIDI
jgi:hypothetical protein